MYRRTLKDKDDTLEELLDEAYRLKIPLWIVLNVGYDFSLDNHYRLINQITSYRDGTYELAKKLLSDSTCNVNDRGRWKVPPLIQCADRACDDDDCGNHQGNEYVRIME